MALVDQGDYEMPNLDQYIDMDQRYLEECLRIDRFVKTFKNQDTKEINYAVDNLSLSVFKN